MCINRGSNNGVLSRIWEFETISASSVAEIAVNAEDIEDAEIVSISHILDMYATLKPEMWADTQG